MIIFDIGACVGAFTDHCLKDYEVESIYQFEPFTPNYRFLIEKYKKDNRVKTLNLAVSNFTGEAKLYKKFKKKNGKRIYPEVGNAGSSLKSDKGNVSADEFEVVKVTSLNVFFNTHTIDKVGICKIDSEGTEYDIINDILNHELYKKMNRICYEDHTRKIRSIKKQKTKTVERIHKLGILNKFFIQTAHEGNIFSYRQLR
jgi:FkbM family methyltransferase